MNEYLQKLDDYFHLDLATKLRSPENGLANACHVLQTHGALPAYQHFLKKNGFEAKDIRAENFHRLPLTTKDNYIKAYPLNERCGNLANMEMFALSSGSTGQATAWPRSGVHEIMMAERFEQVLCGSFQLDEGISTLAIVCFAMGSWVGGMYTAQCCRLVSEKGYPLALVCPGNNKTEILRLVKELAPHYEQIILMGYPPFIKDVLDYGIEENIDWSSYQTKMVFAGEVFSEEWRERLANTNKIPVEYSSASLYGTADGAILGNETPTSICIRRYLAQNPKLARELFGESRLPTLVQYDPQQRYFEVHDQTLVVTGESGVPLLRYHIADKGGIISYKNLLAALVENGFDANANLPRNSWVLPLPFVFLFGRADFTISFYGANIYPENISVALEKENIHAFVTGKFVMQIKTDELGNPTFHLLVERGINIEDSTELQNQIAHTVKAELLRLNSEFANYVPEKHQIPIVQTKTFAHPNYFPAGIKHRYTRKIDD